MKKLIAIFMILIVSKPSYAEWKYEETHRHISDRDGDDWYVDYSSVKKNRDQVFYWEMRDLDEPDEDGTISYKFLMELDCGIPGKIRNISYLWYKLPMGQGSPAGTSNKTLQWNYYPPGSGGETITTAVCEYAETIK